MDKRTGRKNRISWELIMRTIGLIGGMSWKSSLEYYRILNQLVSRARGGLSSARCIMYSVNFEPMKVLMDQGDWRAVETILAEVAGKLERAGADMILICTNTMHICARGVEEAVDIPLINIVDETGRALKRSGIKKAGLLGTRFTMEGNFYPDRMKEKYGIRTIIPDIEDRKLLDHIIFDELCQDTVPEGAREILSHIMNKLENRGAEGIILGCTELPLLTKKDSLEIPLFNTTLVHARSAVKLALST